MFDTLAEGGEPAPEDLAAIGAAFATGLGRAQFVHVGARFDWRWPAGDGAPDRVAWEATCSALELLRDGEP